jgi:predicted ATP-grasp superfamily ATP-dependent carboligase
MKRLFVYEYSCAQAAAKDVAKSLRVEGWAMLTALTADLADLPEVRPRSLLAADCTTPLEGQAIHLEPGQDEAKAFRELAGAADFSLIIAPEFDGLLTTRCRWVEEAGGRLLGPSSAAVRLTADKLALGKYLLGRGVRTPLCYPWSPGDPVAADGYPAVWKPRYGAGSQATFLVRGPDELAACAAVARAEGTVGEGLLQPFVPGQPASVAFLLGPGRCVPLLPAAQHLSADGRFRYLGGSLPLPPPLPDRAIRLAQRAVGTVPGLQGYVGVDLVLGAAADGSQDWVMEINPRLTTSYVGLRALAATNLAEALLSVCCGEEPPALVWKPGRVDFRADGFVSVGQAGKPDLRARRPRRRSLGEEGL